MEVKESVTVIQLLQYVPRLCGVDPSIAIDIVRLEPCTERVVFKVLQAEVGEGCRDVAECKLLLHNVI